MVRPLRSGSDSAPAKLPDRDRRRRLPETEVRAAALVLLLVSGCASAPSPCLFTPSTTSAVAVHAHPAALGLAVFADVAACVAAGEVARPPSLADLERDAAIHRDSVGAASDLLRDLDTWSDASRRRPTQ
jgi:hypothetical protein